MERVIAGTVRINVLQMDLIGAEREAEVMMIVVALAQFSSTKEPMLTVFLRARGRLHLKEKVISERANPIPSKRVFGLLNRLPTAGRGR